MAEFADKLSPEEIAAGFDGVIARASAAGDAAAADRARLLKAYFTDPTFRKALEDETARANGLDS